MRAVNCKLVPSWDVTSGVPDTNLLSSIAAKVHLSLWRFRRALGPIPEKNVSSGLGMFM